MIRWYNRLHPNDQLSTQSLLGACNSEEVYDGLIISQETSNGTRQFSMFRSHVEFYHYFKKTLTSYRRYHEVILPESPQKPRFDLDVSRDQLPSDVTDLAWFGQQVLDHCVTGIMSVLEEDYIEFVPDRNLAVFTSHAQDKMSYHLIINGYIHDNCQEAKAFYYRVIEGIDEKYSNFIDQGIYSRYHSLRTVWSHKLGSEDRVKVFQGSYTIMGYTIDYQLPEARDDDHLNILILEQSLISFTSGCVILPLYDHPSSRDYTDYTDLYHEGIDVKSVDQLIAGSLDPSSEVNPYKISAIKDSIILLRRIHPSYCDICKRVHDVIDPYLTVNNNGNVYFHCRRAPSGSQILIGQINTVDTEAVRWVKSKIANERGIKINEVSIDYETMDSKIPEPKTIQPPIANSPQSDNKDSKSYPLANLTGTKPYPSTNPKATKQSVPSAQVDNPPINTFIKAVNVSRSGKNNPRNNSILRMPYEDSRTESSPQSNDNSSGNSLGMRWHLKPITSMIDDTLM